MYLVKILKRKDAASVILAVLVALIITQPLNEMTGRPASIISGLSGKNAGFFWYGYGAGGDWQAQYLFPVVWILVQLIVLEILCWIVVWAMRPFRRKRG